MESIPISRLPVAVVGGGVAGISAAFHLARAGIPTVLLERSQQLGGRASSYFDRDFGLQLDLGPHVIAGAYRDFLALLRGLGTDRDLLWIHPLHLPFKGTDTPEYHLRFLRLPGLLAPLGGLLSYGALPLAQRFDLVSQLRRLLSTRPVPALTAEAWLKGVGVTPAQMSRFWQPFILATLNALPRQVGVIGLRQIIELGRSEPDGFALGIPTKAWQDIVGSAALSYLRQHGIDVHLRAKVTGIAVEGNRACAVFVDGKRVEVSAVILAVSPWDWKSVLTPGQFESLLNRVWLTPPAAGIHAVHLLCDQPPTTAPMFGLFGTVNQWVFASRLSEGERPWLVSTVVSGSGGLFEYTADEVISMTIKELQDIWPHFRADVSKSTCVRVQRGTCPFEADLEEQRPTQKTRVRGLFLAGDSTATGLPATLESAARAGRFAVQALREAPGGNLP
jgi:squalene-associated FAD-dependent desaturase